MARTFSLTDTRFLHDKTSVVISRPDGRMMWRLSIPQQDDWDGLWEELDCDTMAPEWPTDSPMGNT